MNISRRATLRTLTALAALPLLSSLNMEDRKVMKRKIPSTGEPLPVVGLGTWQTFDVGDNPAERKLRMDVLRILIEQGGSVVDSSPMYGSSENVVGDLSTQIELNEKLFLATKVWTSGKETGVKQMEASMALLRRQRLDLLQIHNLIDWKTHLKTLRNWKESGRVRYIGITHYLDSAHDSVERIMREEQIDFVQINYSMKSRAVEDRLLPLAQEKKIAILVNRPFEEGELFQRVKGKTLPEWAGEFDCESWGQFFLKFILSHPAINCVIPGTSKPQHMVDNLKAGIGKLPDQAQQKRMIGVIS